MKFDLRWEQRFSNFEKAYFLLNEIKLKKLNEYSLLEKEGIIQRFEYTLELGWKTLKDKMENDGIILDIISPKSINREAFNLKYINDAEIWFKLISDKNLMSHNYDLEIFENVISNIQKDYLNVFDYLYKQLKIN